MISNNSNILEKVSNISTIPTLPTVLERITSLMQNPKTSAEEVGKAITRDQSLASKVLKLVNSAFYGFPGKISTITHAVVILGFATIKNIVLTASIFETFRKDSKKAMGFDMEKFWIHSVACGAAAQTLGKHTGSKDKEECFIAGLIHDIGKIILCKYLPKEFNQIIQNVHKKNILIYDSENELFGTSHQEVGGVIAKNWNLPVNLQYAVLNHHEPMRTKDHATITSIVHCADILVRALDFGNGGDNKIPLLEEQVWQTLKLNEKSLIPILEEISEEVEKATIFMEI